MHPRIGGYVEHRPRPHFWRAVARLLFLAALCAGAYLALTRLAACRATVPVVQINSTLTCTVTDVAASGAVSMDCRQDGHKVEVPVTAPGDGPSTVLSPTSEKSGPPGAWRN